LNPQSSARPGAKKAVLSASRAADLRQAQQEVEARMEALNQGREVICRYGTIIHELSHLVSSTLDVQTGVGADNRSVTCYGAMFCLRLASLQPANAITNADNYRLFSESFGK
jgi:hypothetical protein